MELTLPVRIAIELIGLAWLVNIWWWVAEKVAEHRTKKRCGYR
jgi:hypothetical protein